MSNYQENIFSKCILIITMSAFIFIFILIYDLTTHGLTDSDKGIYKTTILPFVYLGTKQMVVGYVQLLFSFGLVTKILK